MSKNLKRRWFFPSNNGGEIKGFNDGAVDQFKGQRLSSSVRELIQNSLDAKKIDKNKPIGVTFKIHSLQKNDVLEITSLRAHLVACREAAGRQERANAVKFYSNAITRIDTEEEIKILAVHDENSEGLTGDPNEDFGAWAALVKGTGISQKPVGSLGSFGHGSKAPFSLSDVRTVFYLSYVKLADSVERRFQGKSILQSHRMEGTDGLTVGTGYYGWSSNSNCGALLNDDIPEWAIKIRADVGHETGTTIIIPYFNLSESELPETAISCISNFYYAIDQGNLSVSVDGETDLTPQNIKAKYYEYRERLDDEQDYIDHKRIKENFESLLAVVEPDDWHRQEVKDLDSFTWYFKLLDEQQEKRTRVVIARRDGMLIKHNPMQLERFPMMKSFEMFVCVDGKRGSDLLKSIENPRHDDFEFDRIDDPEERKQAELGYARLAKKIRERIKLLAEIETEIEVADSTLNKWFKPSVVADEPGQGVERGKTVRISRISSTNRARRPSTYRPADGNVVTLGGQGHRSGKGKKKTDGGTNPGLGKGVVSGRGVKDRSKNDYKPLNNLRLIPITGNDNSVTLVFDNPGEGEHQIIVERVGEEGRERLNILVGDDYYADQISAQFGDASRQELSVESTERLKGYALEARLVIAKKNGGSHD